MKKVINRMSAWMRAQVAPVPKFIEFCEFDCERNRCDAEELRDCMRRQKSVAAKKNETYETSKQTPANP